MICSSLHGYRGLLRSIACMPRSNTGACRAGYISRSRALYSLEMPRSCSLWKGHKLARICTIIGVTDIAKGR